MSGESSAEPEAWAKARQSLAQVVPQRQPSIAAQPQCLPPYVMSSSSWPQPSPYGLVLYLNKLYLNKLYLNLN
jgi:hypothetical protein